MTAVRARTAPRRQLPVVITHTSLDAGRRVYLGTTSPAGGFSREPPVRPARAVPPGKVDLRDEARDRELPALGYAGVELAGGQTDRAVVRERDRAARVEPWREGRRRRRRPDAQEVREPVHDPLQVT